MSFDVNIRQTKNRSLRYAFDRAIWKAITKSVERNSDSFKRRPQVIVRSTFFFMYIAPHAIINDLDAKRIQ